MKPKVTIDARWLVGGIGTYTLSLLEGLSQREHGLDLHAITSDRHAAMVDKFCPRPTIVNAPIYSAREQWAIPRATNGSHLLHVPHYNQPLLRTGRVVITIYDLIHITDPAHRGTLKSWAYARPMLRFAARKARHVITLSNFTRTQIIEDLGIPDSRVSTIYPVVSAEFQPMDRARAAEEVSAQLGMSAPYILYVGNLKPHKNVPTLLKALARLLAKTDLPHRLLVIGGEPNAKRALLDEMERLRISQKVNFASRVDQRLIPKVYAAADALVMPSRAEGFGLPVLEAMCTGTPVVCSHAASLPEVAGDAAEYFDPASPEELAHKLELVLSSESLRVQMRSKGLARAAKFQSGDPVAEHLEVYRRVLAQ